jgi:hypothetical protein
VRNLIRTTLVLAAGASLAACSTKSRQEIDADALRADSLSSARKELLDEVMASTQFVNDINAELAKARAIAAKPSAKLETTTDIVQAGDQRKETIARIAHLVARLDSVQTRLATTRRRAQQLSNKDSSLLAQVAQYEKTIVDVQQSAQQERDQLQAIIDGQTQKIAALTSHVDTVEAQRVALADTLNQLTVEKNTAYYVIGTRDELIRKGVLVPNGPKRFVLMGSRPVVPARELDPANFTKIDRLSDSTIALPAGEYEILSRQNVSFAAPQALKDKKIVGGLTILEPEQFWAASRFLIIVRS